MNENPRSAYNPGAPYFERGMRKSYGRVMAARMGRKQLFGMKTITSFLITGLLVFAQSLEGGEPGGDVGFAHSSSPTVPKATAPAAQKNPAPITPQPGVNIRPGKVPQRSTTRVGQPRTGQGQSEINP